MVSFRRVETQEFVVLAEAGFGVPAEVDGNDVAARVERYARCAFFEDEEFFRAGARAFGEYDEAVPLFHRKLASVQDVFEVFRVRNDGDEHHDVDERGMIRDDDLFAQPRQVFFVLDGERDEPQLLHDIDEQGECLADDFAPDALRRLAKPDRECE
ncbi:MAG: hypothetical protein WCS54_06780 [Fibrobacteraceae bacterium]